MFRLALGLVAVLPAFTFAQTHQVKLNGHTFTLPQGFTIELAAGADLAPRPIVADFDEKGRLYVCDSSGSNEKVAEQLEKKPHRIVRLESTKGDGKFDKQTVCQERDVPGRAMWLNGSLYVATHRTSSSSPTLMTTASPTRKNLVRQQDLTGTRRPAPLSRPGRLDLLV